MLFAMSTLLVLASPNSTMSPRIAIAGQGVIGCSTALAILERIPKAQVGRSSGSLG